MKPSKNTIARFKRMDWRSRASYAKDPLATKDQLEILKADPNWNVKLLTVLNASCPEDILIELSSDPHEAVSQAAAEQLKRIAEEEASFAADMEA